MTEKTRNDIVTWLSCVKRIFFESETGNEWVLRDGHRFWTFEQLLMQQYCGNEKFGLPKEAYIETLEIARRNDESIDPLMVKRLSPLLCQWSAQHIFFGKFDRPLTSENLKRIDWNKCHEVWGSFDEDPTGFFEEQRLHYLQRYSEEGQRQDRSGQKQREELLHATRMKLEYKVKRLKQQR